MKTVCLTKEAFRALPQKQKALLVAKDVIELIKSKKIQTESMRYLYFGLQPPRLREDISATSKKGKSILLNGECEVCAKGAIFMASIFRTNSISVNEVIDCAEDSWVSLDIRVCDIDRIFNRRQFCAIEAAFEGWNYRSVWRRKFPINEDRLVAICVNIIKNKGVFNSKKITTLADMRKFYESDSSPRK